MILFFHGLSAKSFILGALLAVVTSFEATAGTLWGVAVHRVPMRLGDPESPYSLALTNGSDLLPGVATKDFERVNFLATQVWPSARTAALALERYFQSNKGKARKTVLCEFGCGPGLPSLTAAKLGASRVYATDLDVFALELVKQAAAQQGLSDRLETRMFDLVQSSADEIPIADSYVFSDVFENGAVAEGAARITAQILEHRSASVWVFAQSDRAQREIFLRELQRLLFDPTLSWHHSTSDQESGPTAGSLQWNGRLWLCDIDETRVFYG